MDSRKYGVDKTAINKLKAFQLALAKKNKAVSKVKMDFREQVSGSINYGPPRAGQVALLLSVPKLFITFDEWSLELPMHLRTSLQIQNEKIVMYFHDYWIEKVELIFENATKANSFATLMPPIERPFPTFETLDFSESFSDDSSGREGTKRSESEDDNN